MLNRDAISLQSLFSIATHSELNHLGMLRANQNIGQAGVSADINLQSGKLLVRDHVLSFPDMGGNIEFGMVYVGQTEAEPWQLCATRMIKQITAGKCILLREPDGASCIYQYKNGQYEYADNDGVAVIKFDQASQSFVWCHPGKRVTEYFSKENNLVTTSINAQGLVTEYKYQNNKLDRIVAPSKLQYKFTYTENKIAVTRKTETTEMLLHTYVINENNCLDKSLTRDGYEINYQYDDNKKLAAVTQTDKTECHFMYYADGDDKNKLQFLCMGDQAENALSLHYQALDTRVMLPSRECLQLTFNDQQQLSSSNLIEQSYQYEFHPNGQLKTLHHPDKSAEHFEYHPITGLLVRHVKRDGSHDEFEYSKDAEPVLIRMSHYAAGSNNPLQVKRFVYALGINNRKYMRFEISNNGSVCEYEHNEQGLIGSVKQYLRARYEQNAIPDQQAMDTWLQNLAPANRYDNVHYTAFEYHPDGQIKRKCKYSALLSNGKGDSSKPYQESVFKKDENGNPLLTSMLIDQQSQMFSKTRREFDSLNRTIKVIAGEATTAEQVTIRECKQEKIIEKAANGQVHELTLNAAGLVQNEFAQLQDQSKMQVHLTKVVRNLAKKVRVTSHSDLTNEFEYLDATGRVGGQVGKSGQVIKIEYNESSRYQKKIAYANKVSASVAELSAGLVMPEKRQKKTGSLTHFMG